MGFSKFVFECEIGFVVAPYGWGEISQRSKHVFCPSVCNKRNTDWQHAQMKMVPNGKLTFTSNTKGEVDFNEVV